MSPARSLPEDREKRDGILVHDDFWGFQNEIFVNAAKVFWSKV